MSPTPMVYLPVLRPYRLRKQPRRIRLRPTRLLVCGLGLAASLIKSIRSSDNKGLCLRGFLEPRREAPARCHGWHSPAHRRRRGSAIQACAFDY